MLLDMLTISGSMLNRETFPVGVSELRSLFLDLPRLLQHVQSVAEVQCHDDGIYRILMKRVGALNFYVWLAYDVRLIDDGDVIRAINLPFDPADPWIGDGVLLSEYASETRLFPDAAGTVVEHEVQVQVHVPLPGFLEALPLTLVKNAADAVLRTELVKILKETENSARRQLAALGHS